MGKRKWEGIQPKEVFDVLQIIHTNEVLLKQGSMDRISMTCPIYLERES